jgi:hypothetical protein
VSRPRSKLTEPEDIAAAAVMWLARIERKIICKRFDCSHATLWRVMKQNSPVMKQQPDSPTAEISPLMGVRKAATN